ncbi:MAG: HAD family phosphatase [Elusimicrobia bacterium]|nr:HAD family phosphatase [Elusimicrobiota bacterium]
MNRKRLLPEHPRTRPRTASPAIRAVFFDIGNVLLHFEPHCIYKRFLRILGGDHGRIAGFLRTEGLLDAIERGHLSPRGFFGMFRDAFGYRGSFRSFTLLWSNHFTLDRATAAMLKTIARTRKVYLLSNTNGIHYGYIRERYAFTRHIHGACLSHEMGLRKPEPAIYRESLRMAGVAPREAVFIDDLPENVRAARKIGLRAIVYPGPKKLRSRLVRLGILNDGRGRAAAPRAKKAP